MISGFKMIMILLVTVAAMAMVYKFVGSDNTANDPPYHHDSSNTTIPEKELANPEKELANPERAKATVY